MNEHTSESDALLNALEQETGHIITAFTASEGIAVASSPCRETTQVMLMSYEKEGSGFLATILETQEVSGGGIHQELGEAEEAALIHRRYVRDNIPDDSGRIVIEKRPQVVGDVVRMLYKRHGVVAYPAVWMYRRFKQNKVGVLRGSGSR